MECPCSEDDAFATPRSLVQSVLEATAMRENKKELPAAVSKFYSVFNLK